MNKAAKGDKKLLNKILSPGFKLGEIEVAEKLKNALYIAFIKGWRS